MKHLLATIALAVAFAFTACETENERPALTIPAAYDASQFEQNTAAERTVLNSLKSLAAETVKGRTGNKLTIATLNAAYAAVKPQTTAFYDGQVQQLFTEIIAASGGQKFRSTGNQGGIYGAYLLSANGIDMEEVIDKGLYGAALYNYAAKISQDPDATTADRMLALFGTSPAFPNSNNATKHPVPDALIANYIARRDKNDGNGIYTAIKSNFIKLQAAAKAGSTYNQERDEALKGILQNWEKGSAATSINYLQSVISRLSGTTLDEATVASAMHSLGEAIGFQRGFKTVPNKMITDAQIDEILLLMNVPEGKAPSTLAFINSPATELPKLQQAVVKLQNIYGFTDAQIEDFKKNWINEQGR